MANQQRVPLPGSDRQLPAGASPAGDVPSDEIVSATVVLRRAGTFEPAAAPHLTRDAYVQQASASTDAMDAVARFAREHGLTVTSRDARRRSVVLAGTADAMAEAFGVPLGCYQTADQAATFRGRTGPVMLPDDLAPYVLAVLGLDNRPVAKPHFRVQPVTRAAGGGFTPLQLATLYDFPQKLNGAGQTIAIVELGGGYRPKDLAAYFKALGIPAPQVTAVSVGGAVNKPGNSADVEVVLDIEVAGAIAPASHIAVYFAKNTDQGFHDAITMAVHDTIRNPSIISISWGGPEDSWTPQARDAMNAALQDAAAMGVTVTVAAGDDGATDGVDDGQFHCDFPAASPFVLACGGTKVTASGSSIASEVVWNELATGNGATGGGVSRFFAVPTYQANANVPNHPQTHQPGRGVPDISGDADPATGYIIHVNGKDAVIGGTSAVAPLWAGLVALLNQQNGRPLGFVNPKLYALPPATFRDITQGGNGGYNAGAVWDACTGLGSPDGNALLKALTPQAVTTAAEPLTTTIG